MDRFSTQSPAQERVTREELKTRRNPVSVTKKSMTSPRLFLFCPRVSTWLLASLALTLGGCKAIFVPKHKVLVDSISSPTAVKPTGQSYRLVAKKTVLTQGPVSVPVVAACLNAALSGQGMFEAPPNAPPDIFIEVGFGMDASPRADPSTRETFLQLKARGNIDRSLDRGTGEELWDVRVAVLGLAGRVEQAMPLLSSVAADYLATNTKMERKIEVPQDSPAVVAVRETAIKSLEPKTPGAASSNAPAMMSPIKLP